jgi:uncharacterized membrane protein
MAENTQLNNIDLDIVSLIGGSPSNQFNHHPENEETIFDTLDMEVIPNEQMHKFDNDSTRVGDAKFIANFRHLMGYESPEVSPEVVQKFQEQIVNMGGVDLSKESRSKLKLEMLSKFQKEINRTIGSSKQEIIEKVIDLLENSIKEVELSKNLDLKSKDELQTKFREIAKEQIIFMNNLSEQQTRLQKTQKLEHDYTFDLDDM